MPVHSLLQPLYLHVLGSMEVFLVLPCVLSPSHAEHLATTHTNGCMLLRFDAGGLCSLCCCRCSYVTRDQLRVCAETRSGPSKRYIHTQVISSLSTCRSTRAWLPVWCFLAPANAVKIAVRAAWSEQADVASKNRRQITRSAPKGLSMPLSLLPTDRQRLS